jgi:hypothetical protein
MTTLRATVKDRRLELSAPADWPDGTEVEIHPLSQGPDAAILSPEEITDSLAAMDRVEPFDQTDDERAAWERDRQTRKESEKARFAAEAERLRGMWE